LENNFRKNLITNNTYKTNERRESEKGMKCKSEMVVDNFTKLIKFVNDFNGFESMRELTAAIYLNKKLAKKFNYPDENFDFHSEKGGDNKEIEWDIVSLELAELLTTKASVKITEQGKITLEQNPLEIDFSDFKNYLLQLERKLWPAAALYLYTNNYYSTSTDDEKKNISQSVLQKYGFTQQDIICVESFLQK
jgi:hypothetical protein